jgi:chemotaxis response regulator CheB
MVIGTSSGGVEALRRLAGDLPPELPAALFVVMHVPEWASSVPPGILEESALMADRLAARSHQHQHGHAAARFERRAEDARQQARIIRQVLTEGTTEAV